MKKIWLLLIVIALGGCKMSEDTNEEETFNLTIINNSDETVAIRFAVWLYNYYDEKVSLCEAWTCIFAKEKYTIENCHFSADYNNITNYWLGSKLSTELLETPLHFEKDTTITLNVDYDKYCVYVESIS